MPLRRIRSAPVAINPIPSSAIVVGSGTELVGVPASVLPAVVPNENVAAVIVVLAVTVGTEIVNVVPLSRNGLCGPLPAIEPFALE